MKKILNVKGGKLFILAIVAYLSIPLWNTGLQKDLIQFIQWVSLDTHCGNWGRVIGFGL